VYVAMSAVAKKATIGDRRIRKEDAWRRATLINWADDNERKRFLNERQRVATAF